MTRAAIVEPAITQLVADAREMMTALSEAETAVGRHEKQLEDARLTLQVRRAEIGRHLLKARTQLPKRGTKENGWGAFLEAIDMDEATAFRYMKLAENTKFHGDGTVKDRPPSYAEIGLDRREGPQPPAAPPPRDEDAPREADEQATDVDEVEIDRDTWCTPKWITDAIGEWDLDPCANDRSHVQAKKYFELERRGEDGLVLASSIRKNARVFINPPYSDVTPWIEAYGHTRFCFLLKVDPSTAWFELLISKSELVLIPRRTRVQFEAPEGVPREKSLANQFPHALFYARATDATDAIAALCYPGWFINRG